MGVIRFYVAIAIFSLFLPPLDPILNPSWLHFAPQDSSKTAPDGPRSSQDAPKTAQDAPKTPPRRPKTPQDAPKTPQDVARCPQDASWADKDTTRQPQDTPKSTILYYIIPYYYAQLFAHRRLRAGGVARSVWNIIAGSSRTYIHIHIYIYMYVYSHIHVNICIGNQK